MQAVVDTLREHGIDCVEVEEEGYVHVEVLSSDDDERDFHELIIEIEAWLTEKGLPFVAQEVDGLVVIRPPAA
jgi:hypothetical protein